MLSAWPVTLPIWPTDLNINRDHLLIIYYLSTKAESSRIKHWWVLSCTRYGRSTWPLTLTFDLLTWISIRIFYSSKTIYLPSVNLLGQGNVELLVAHGVGDQHDFCSLPTNLNIKRDHLLIKDNLPTNFKASGVKCSWVISCTGFRETDISTDRRTRAKQKYVLLLQRGYKSKYFFVQWKRPSLLNANHSLRAIHLVYAR